MSASEKLRALTAEANSGPDDEWPPPEVLAAAVTLRNALPLIASVVEALETCDREFGEHLPPAGTPWRPVRAALTALREHLEGGE